MSGSPALGGVAFTAASPSQPTSSPSSQWQSLVRLRLEERDARERAFDEIIENYQRLTRFAKQQSDRNASLLAAAGAIKPSAGMTSSESTASTSTLTPKSSLAAAASVNAAAQDSPQPPLDGSAAAVKQAYIASLETQLQSTRDELATLYKTQSQNAQRLLVLSEQVRTRDERDRETGEESRRANEELQRLRRKEEDLRGVVGEKDKMIQILQDELSALSLELNQVELRNDDLKRDNASLLQRWLDRMNDEAQRMNDGNKFLQEVDRRRVGESDAVGVDSSGAGAAKDKE